MTQVIKVKKVKLVIKVFLDKEEYKEIKEILVNKDIQAKEDQQDISLNKHLLVLLILEAHQAL